MKSKAVYFILILSVLASCREPQKKIESNPDLIVVDFDNIRREDTLLLSSLFKKVTPIPLETTDDVLIGEIDGFQVFDNMIFVFD
ncbi:MAG: 6-bladed beta-propeller, partial [Tannerella sp.]|nr:6-bladed beta-propeller [Tannerella sp.]